MELMSPMLFCILLVLFSRGISSLHKNVVANEQYEMETRLNQQSGINVSKLNELQSILTGTNCKECVDCIEKTINAQYNNYAYNLLKSHDTGMNNEIVIQHDVSKDKRHAAARRSDYKTKKSRLRKNKQPKSVSVIKYSVDEDVYALKVNEIKTKVTGEFNNTTLTTSVCQVYQVKKSASCNTPESEVLLAIAKKKASKRKDTRSRIIRTTYGTSTERAYAMMPGLSYLLNKREVDPMNLVDNIMPSVEDSFGY